MSGNSRTRARDLDERHGIKQRESTHQERFSSLLLHPSKFTPQHPLTPKNTVPSLKNVSITPFPRTAC